MVCSRTNPYLGARENRTSTRHVMRELNFKKFKVINIHKIIQVAVDLKSDGYQKQKNKNEREEVEIYYSEVFKYPSRLHT